MVLFSTDKGKRVGYSIIQPPFTLRFSEMPRKELDAYGRWFHTALLGRIAELTNAVKGTPGFQSWEANLTPESLDVLGRWFEGQVETRRQGADELDEVRAKLVFPVDVPEDELTNRTFSLAMDIGMYFSQVILKNVPGTRWDQPLKNKQLADYGQPVLMGLGPVPLNPVNVLVMTAYAIARGEPAKLRELYETWMQVARS